MRMLPSKFRTILTYKTFNLPTALACAIITFCLGASLFVFSLPIAAAKTTYYQVEAVEGADNAAKSSSVNMMRGGVTPRPSTTEPTHFVDCSAASTSGDGSVSSPWKNLSQVSGLQPGNTLGLIRGCTWNETLNASWSGTDTQPITVTSYGDPAAAMPMIQRSTNNTNAVTVTGSYLVFDGIEVKGIAPALEAGCENNPKGYIVGFNLRSGATYNTISNSKASGFYAGVYVNSGSHHNTIKQNQLINNNMMNPLDTVADNDAGAFGVLLHGDDNEIVENQINGSVACSYDYAPHDGSAVELYGGQRNRIHHNKASGNNGFSEMGNSRTADNVLAYNQVVSDISDSYFLITRGAGSSYGPVLGTVAYNNTVYLTGSSSQGVVCHSGCSTSILTLKNNILWADWKALYADATFIESNNIYWKTGGSPLIQNVGSSTVSASSKKANPLFVAVGSDFHLQSSSPAIDAGSSDSVSAGFTTDLDNMTVPAGPAVDMGAYEFSSTPPPDTTPPPAPTLTAIAISSSQINLSWNAVTDPSGINGYNVYRGTTATTITTRVNSSLITTTSLDDTGLTANTTYYYQVEAVDGADNAAKSSAANATTQAPQTLTFAPSADAWVSQQFPTRTYGTSTLLKGDASPNQDILMNFSVSGIGTKRVTSAKLRLYVANGSDKGGDIYKLLTTSWDEASVSWNTAPAHNPTVITSLGAVTQYSTIMIDLTGQILSDGSYGFKFSIPSNNNVVYNSKEATANQPQLVLTVE